MTLLIDDLLGLNTVTLASMPIAHSADSLKALLQSPNKPVALTGSRHSQGGHTVMPQGMAVLTEPMNRVLHIDREQRNVTAQAGTTWNVLHAHLAPLGLAPLVQQSSPHFTLGGSISVNCHGRDPGQGPLSNNIVSLDVLLPSTAGAQTQTIRPGDALFKAVVGGYGSAAVILNATLKITDNTLLRQRVSEVNLTDYAQEMANRQAQNQWPALHYAWLNFSTKALFKTVLKVDCEPIEGEAGAVLTEDGWLEIELMRWLWEQHSQNDGNNSYRNKVWKTLVTWFNSQNHENNGQGKQRSRIDWLRQSVGFTAHRSDTHAGLLQEFFVPIDRLAPFVTALGTLLIHHKVNLLSSTIRVVQKEDNPCFLSYAHDQAMACIAIDFECPLVSGPTSSSRMPAPASFKWVREAIDLALAHQGRYYLPYFGFATREQFRRAYPHADAQRQARHPELNNLFLDTYLT
jgi:decaprenylphospho-beta-D-ribofuranose 2-oxidase